MRLMRLIPFTLSKGQIQKAGETLRVHPTDFGSLATLSEFRSAHVYPLNAIQDHLRKKAKEITKKSIIISQRLKRVPSILSKLARQSEMNLARMQDVGGCRAVFTSVNEVYACLHALEGSKMSHNPPKRIVDYIENPKKSGYRGIHIVYEFHSKSKTYEQYNGMLIEIQLRTLLQHYWATAVETVGIFTGEALKSSQGSEDWQEFFRLVSNWFALKEGQNLIEGLPYEKESLREMIQKYITLLKVRETLLGFSHAIRFIDKISKEERQKAGYILLILDTKEASIQIQRFTDDKLNLATDLYGTLEQKYVESPEKQVVLLSIESAISLRKAYPNYFGDTTDFMKHLEELFS